MEGSGDSWERIETPSYFGLLGFRLSDMLLIEVFFLELICALMKDGGCLCSYFLVLLCLRGGSEGKVRWTVRRRERMRVLGMNEQENVIVVRK